MKYYKSYLGLIWLLIKYSLELIWFPVRAGKVILYDNQKSTKKPFPFEPKTNSEQGVHFINCYTPNANLSRPLLPSSQFTGYSRLIVLPILFKNFC